MKFQVMFVIDARSEESLRAFITDVIEETRDGVTTILCIGVALAEEGNDDVEH